MNKKRHTLPLSVIDRLEQAILDCGDDCIVIGRKLGYERKTIYSYKDGNTTPDAYFIKRFCEQYNLSADELLGIDHNNKYWRNK